MPFKMLISEFRTGIILDDKAQNRHLGASTLPYRYADSLAELRSFATALLRNTKGLEVIIWDSEDNYIQTITAPSL
jgi:hypothetical protein